MACLCGGEEIYNKTKGSMIYGENLLYKEGGDSFVYIGVGGVPTWGEGQSGRRPYGALLSLPLSLLDLCDQGWVIPLHRTLGPPFHKGAKGRGMLSPLGAWPVP
jgi:hypothetical protein